MDFGAAIAALNDGQRVTRAGWNGADQWLILVPGSTITVEADRPLGKAAPDLVGGQAGEGGQVDGADVFVGHLHGEYHRGHTVPCYMTQDLGRKSALTLTWASTDDVQGADVKAAQGFVQGRHPGVQSECLLMASRGLLGAHHGRLDSIRHGGSATDPMGRPYAFQSAQAVGYSAGAIPIVSGCTVGFGDGGLGCCDDVPAYSAVPNCSGVFPDDVEGHYLGDEAG